MARPPAAANGGWPTPRQAPQGQRPAQPAGYGQGYPEQQGYHYPQNGQPAQPGPRQGLSSLDPVNPQLAPEFPPYAGGQSYGQPQAPAQGMFRPAPAPFGAPARQDPMPDPRTAAAGYEQWPMGAPQDPGYELGNFLPAGAPRPGGMPDDPLQQQPEWASYASGQMGYEPAHGGALEQSYAQDEGGDYETDEPRRGSWTLRIVGAIVVAIGLGYGLAQGYKLVADSQPDGAPPVVRGDSAPSKTKPTDPGGKQFAHTDSKIMGRLGEGTPGGEPSAGASDSDADVNGARKVQTLVVGRDGSIAPPAAPEEPATTGAVAVPGLTVVDGFGGRYPQPVETAAAPEPTSQPGPQAARQPIVVKPPAPETKPVKVAKATTIETAEPEPAPEAPDTPDTTSSAAPAAAPAEPEEPKKTAAVAPPPSGGANGYVVVLASVPASGDSRLSALRKFADMQQKYGTVLQNRTPDVQEANLGAKGTYHRLLVGPPGSRAQASALCNDLKTAGYKDCWVMAY